MYHPVSSAVSRQPIEYYKFCGAILAKCVVEAMVRGACTRLSNVKFTKSFLAYMLGYPIHYKHLESDEPNYYREISHIITGDMTDYNYTFTTNLSDTATTNLIPNGSAIPVSNGNKEHYLNLLAKHRLIHRVDQEISAIRSGFYSVMDKDKLCDFQKDDLQELISGGASFHINDLKAHHRLIREIDNQPVNPAHRRNPGIDYQKIIKWFFIAVQNMSEKEHSYLVFCTTGSFALPSCGFKDLTPLFTINMTGTYNERPQGNPQQNEIILGDFSEFEHFERALLQAIRPESERNALPQTTTENRMYLYNPHHPRPLAIMGPEDGNMGGCNYHGGRIGGDPPLYSQQDQLSSNNNEDNSWFQLNTIYQDPIVNWLREMINL